MVSFEMAYVRGYTRDTKGTRFKPAKIGLTSIKGIVHKWGKGNIPTLLGYVGRIFKYLHELLNVFDIFLSLSAGLIPWTILNSTLGYFLVI